MFNLMGLGVLLYSAFLTAELVAKSLAKSEGGEDDDKDGKELTKPLAKVEVESVVVVAGRDDGVVSKRGTQPSFEEHK